MLSCSAPEVKGDTATTTSSTEFVHPDMDWIQGTWVGGVESEGLVSKEVWTKVSKDLYAGDAETRQDGKVVSTEHMEISTQDGHHCFIVDHGGSAPVVFDFSFEDELGFKCRNEENDFPKQIEYRLEGEELVAVISEGGPTMEFRFERIE